VSQTNELSPFDIKSIDESGQVTYIEVKSARSDDPSEPFCISQAELDKAISKRDRNYIYRVTSTYTADSQVKSAFDLGGYDLSKALSASKPKALLGEE
jgi:hypothetical protein